MAEEKLPFTEHLTELRQRLIKSFVAVLIGFGLSFNFSEQLFRLLTLPLRSDLHLKTTSPYLEFITKDSPIQKLVFLAPAEAFWMNIKVAMVAGIVLALPVALYQLWKFIAPGLMPSEKKYVGPFVVSGTLLFLVGALFCFTIILPFAMGFLLTYKTASLTPMISVGSYVDFCLKFLLSFGAVFELPIVILFLTRTGVVTPKTLAKNRKYAVLLAFVLAAVLTPTPDAFNQTLMAVPIIILYETGIIISKIFSKKKAPDEGN
ncbi:sec-independent protein translocase protein TatC [bacterium BMS3Bbin07]|nr:sec-independent protein translocase protein TatC [bacterium BMS3Bbin07]HDH02491.1 twin-arginine translocase subunit TatC [Nitrospirota bacterium]